jgi:hypothetical protein
MMSLMAKMIYATEAVAAAEAGDVDVAALNFIAAHATDQQDKGAEEMIVQVADLADFLANYGLALTETEVEQLLARLTEREGLTIVEND